MFVVGLICDFMCRNNFCGEYEEDVVEVEGKDVELEVVMERFCELIYLFLLYRWFFIFLVIVLVF